MHSSIAKALTKGKIRHSQTKLDELKDVLDSTVPQMGKKNTLAFLEFYCKSFKQLLIKKIEKKKLSSWHKKVALVSVMARSVEIDDIGRVHAVAIHFLCTRDHQKKGKSFTTLFGSPFSMHEHFLQRVLQRTNGQSSNIINDLILQALIGCSLLNLNLPLGDKELPRAFHILSKKYVLIVTFHPSKKVFIFNTILLLELFTEQQNLFYSPLFEAMRNERDCYSCYSVYDKKILPLNYNADYSFFRTFCEQAFFQVAKAEN